MPYFEKIEGFSAYFHQIDLQGQTITTEYGKVGGTHKQSSKTFPTAQKAQIAYEKLLNEKKTKGYREPDNKAIPDERIDWTPKLIASLPIIRGIHTPPLELVLKPLVINFEHPENHEYDLRWLTKIISPCQTLITNRLNSHEHETEPSLTTMTIWADYIDNLLAFPKRESSLWEAVRDLFGQSMAAGLILLGSVTAGEIFIERLYIFSLNNYDCNYPVLEKAMQLLRHQTALLPDAEYEYLLGVASRRFRQSIYYMDMVLIALFPTQQVWAEDVIDNDLQGHIVHEPSRPYVEHKRNNRQYEGGKKLLCDFPCVCSLKHFQKLYEATWHHSIKDKEATLWLHLYGLHSLLLFDFCIKKNMSDYSMDKMYLKNILSIFTCINAEAAVDILIKHKRNKIVSELLSIQSRRWPDFMRKKLQP